MLKEITNYCYSIAIEDYIARGGYSGLKKALKLSPQKIIEAIKSACLRGRGGAGFPTGAKWESVPEIFPRYIVCNADEGEPGTFKDRLLLKHAPHLIIEGIIISGYANLSQKGYIYIRGEYPEEAQVIQKAIEEAHQKGFLGKNILGLDFNFSLEVKRGGGSYVVGDETALLNSLMGNRGNPWLKPPYPTQAGLWEKPTIVNNVETLACVSLILQKGSDYFKTFGTADCSGSKLFCVSGNIEKPGVYEFPMGTPLKEILSEAELKGNLKAVQIGGTAGPIYGPEALEFKLDYTSMKNLGGSLGSGAIIIMNNRVNMVDVLEVTMRFFSEESCGKCFPCRYGTRQLEFMSSRIAIGKGKLEYLPLMEKTVQTMQQTSLCPFGQSVILPLSGILKNFKPEIESFIQHQKYIRGGRYE